MKQPGNPDANEDERSQPEENRQSPSHGTAMGADQLRSLLLSALPTELDRIRPCDQRRDLLRKGAEGAIKHIEVYGSVPAMLFGQQLLSEFLLLRLKNRDVYEVMEMYLVLSFTQNSVLLAGMVREGVREFFEPALCAEDREFVVQAGGKFAGYDEDVG